MEPSLNFFTPPSSPNPPLTPASPPMPRTRSATPATKHGRLFILGLAGIASGGIFFILSLVAFFLAANVNQKEAPQASVLPNSNPTATTLTATETSLPIQPSSNPTATNPPAMETGLPVSTLTPTEQSPGGDATRFRDDFSNTNSGWFVGSTDNYDVGYFQGQSYAMGIKVPSYYFISLSPDPFPDPVSNSIITVRTRQVDGDPGQFGVVCRYQNVDNFYLAGFSGDHFYIGKQVNGTFAFLTDPGWQILPDATPDQDGYWTIGLSCIDSFIDLEVNGIGTAHVTDEQFNAGNAGLCVWSGNQIGQSNYYVQAYFDDFSAELPQAP